jgi:hypothetical protein
MQRVRYNFYGLFVGNGYATCKTLEFTGGPFDEKDVQQRLSSFNSRSDRLITRV